MRKRPFHPKRAYNNLDFLNGPQARALRILSEFLEPMDRFRREGVKDTIVIFGSARILPRKLAKKKLNKIKSTILKQRRLTLALKRKLEDATVAFDMSVYYEEAAELTFRLTKWSMKLNKDRHYVVCSGGGPGIMEAANKGAKSAGGKSIGLNISLPFEQESNPYVAKNLSFEFHYFFMRKFWFVYLAKALIMFPGGFGTLDELMEVLTLLQTRKVKKYMPIVLYGSRYWKEVLNFDAMVRHKTISKSDLKLFRFADTPNEAFKYLTKKLIQLREE